MPEYVVGPARYRTHARLETKPSRYLQNGQRDSGGGYERIRSWEFRPHTHREGKEDVYVAVHRLNAVAWLLPGDEPLDLSLLDGIDVHHGAPEAERDRGVPWDNREAALHLREHGRHSEITQRELETYGKVAKDRAFGDDDREAEARCARCDDPADVLCESADWEGRYCLACSQAASDGASIEVV